MQALSKAALIILGFSAVAVANTEDIVFVHELRVAFYEPAPKKLSRSMHAAVTTACEGSEALDWLCGGEALRFVRGVYVNGNKQQNGYVCLAESLGDLKFYPVEMTGEAQCIFVCYNGDTKQHFIDPAELQTGT